MSLIHPLNFSIQEKSGKKKKHETLSKSCKQKYGSGGFVVKLYVNDEDEGKSNIYGCYPHLLLLQHRAPDLQDMCDTKVFNA